MYPFFSKEEVWEICMGFLGKDNPFSNFDRTVSEFRKEFDPVFEQVIEEHSHIRNKYYRSKNKKPIVNPLVLEHYARLMYYFSHRLFLKGIDTFILDQIFLSIKSRCCIDLFYEFELKQYFLPQHAFAAVLGRARYSEFLVITQNCTIGNNKGRYPELGKGVVLRPGSMVLGDCKIGDNVHIGAGVLIIDEDIPANSVVFGQVPNLVIRKNPESNIDLFFD